MLKASVKDILRTIGKEKKRFFSIMTITILGVTMMTGLQAGCEDLRLSADRFYDEQKLFDISIMSTLGLTDEDVEIISAMEGIELAEGSYSEVVHTKKGEINKTAEVKIIQSQGLNRPYLVEGRLPQGKEEIAVTKTYLQDTGKKIGDWLEIEEMIKEEKENIEDEVSLEEEEEPNFPNTHFQITGTIIDVTDINNAEGAAGFRATPNADYTFFVTKEAVKTQVYSAVYASLEGSDELLCYSSQYEAKTLEMIEAIESEIMEQRQKARYTQITKEAYEKIEEKEEEMTEEFTKAEQELSDAKEEIKEAKADLVKGEKELKDGWEEIREGRKELEEKEQEALLEIADGKKELEEAYEQLNQGWAALNEAEKELNIGEAQLEEGKELLRHKEAEARQKLLEAEINLQKKQQENQLKTEQLEQVVQGIKTGLEGMGSPWSETLQEAWNTYVEQTAQIAAMAIGPLMEAGEEDPIKTETALKEALQQAMADPGGDYALSVFDLNTQLAANTALNQMVMAGMIPEIGEMADLISLATGQGTCNATALLLQKAEQKLKEQKDYAEQEIAAGWAKLEAGEKELLAGRKQLSAGRAEVIENYQKYEEGVKELQENEEKAYEEFAKARQKLAQGEEDLLKAEKDLLEGEKELLEGEDELTRNEQEYLEEKKEAEQKIAEAKAEVAEIDMTKWYVQDRSALSGYSNVKSDTGAIESLATVFAVVFFIVAILMSLTTVTRMVEEERGLIGTYKALGFQDNEIGNKYLIYTLAAGGLGAVLGNIGGFVVLPEILFVFFKVMYLFPEYILRFNPFLGILAGCLFLLGIVGAGVFACRNEVRHLPAQLMRPKAPRAGTRVFLEYIRPLWSRMSFLNKVTARNLFRYKKRMFMTLFGIAGCTALLVFGLAIKDSVSELMPLQYEKVYQYDLLAAVNGEDNEKLLDYANNASEITQYVNLQIESVKIKNQNKDTEKLQLMVFEKKDDFLTYLSLGNQQGETIKALEGGIYVTENAAKMLELKKGDKAFLQRLDLTQKEVEITDLVKNYLGNNIYMTKETYEQLFGVYEPNGILAHLSPKLQDPIGFSDELAKEDWVLSSISTRELKEGFSQAFTLINLVVYVVLVLAAGLAFVVLFTLASINISERERELATIKVLGFFDREVHSYVNKETMILTMLGIMIGLPVGAVLSSMLTELLKMPSIYFAVTIYPRSYGICAAIALSFALIVQLLTNRSLNVIDPVEALKSVE